MSSPTPVQLLTCRIWRVYFHQLFFLNPGLFLCGQDVMCSGFVPSMMSGLLCASAVLKTNLLNDLVLLHKKVKAATRDSQRSKAD